GEGLRPLRMVGAGLEPAGHRLLRGAGRPPAVGMDHLPPHRPGAAGSGRERLSPPANATTPRYRGVVVQAVCGAGRGSRSGRASSRAWRMERRRRSSARRVKYQARKVNSEMTSRIRLAMALMSGFTPRRTAEKISIGRVVAPGP